MLAGCLGIWYRVATNSVPGRSLYVDSANTGKVGMTAAKSGRGKAFWYFHLSGTALEQRGPDKYRIDLTYE